jgi:hypothetical protein
VALPKLLRHPYLDYSTAGLVAFKTSAACVVFSVALYRRLLFAAGLRDLRFAGSSSIPSMKRTIVFAVSRRK